MTRKKEPITPARLEHLLVKYMTEVKPLPGLIYVQYVNRLRSDQDIICSYHAHFPGVRDLEADLLRSASVVKKAYDADYHRWKQGAKEYKGKRP